MMGWGYGWGWFGMVFKPFFWIIVIVAIILLIRWLGHRRGLNQRQKTLLWKS